MYTNNRDKYREAFHIAWLKYQKKQPLIPVESELVDIILMHPEYENIINRLDSYQYQDFTLEENPFLHMALHQALREQLSTNRPIGIKHYQQLFQQKLLDQHLVEHEMMTCLAQMIWKAQQSGIMPNDTDYLKMLDERLVGCESSVNR